MVQTVRILNIDWVRIDGGIGELPLLLLLLLCWRTHLSRSLCGAVIFMRHVFICIYYCFAYNLLAGGKFSARNENLSTALPLSLTLFVCVYVRVFVCLFASVISVSACLELLSSLA